MKRILIAAMALSLSACSFGSINSAASVAATAADAAGAPAPSTVANKTVLDEQAMLAVELSYKAARIAVETGVDAGLIKGSLASRFGLLNSEAFKAVGVVRAAYNAGNASSYGMALAQARVAVADLLSLTGKAN